MQSHDLVVFGAWHKRGEQAAYNRSAVILPLPEHPMASFSIGLRREYAFGALDDTKLPICAVFSVVMWSLYVP